MPAMTGVFASIGALVCLGLFAGRAAGLVPHRLGGRAMIGVIAFGVIGASWVFPLLPLLFVGWIVLGSVRNDRRRTLKAARLHQLDGKWDQMTGQDDRACCDSGQPHTHRHRPYEAAAAGAPRRRRPYDPPVPETPVTRAEQGLLEYAGDVRLPASSRDRVGALHDRLIEASKYVQDRGLSSGLQGFGLDQIRDDFAPNAIKSYLALPPSTAQTTVLVDGKTGADLLNEQLDLLIRGVDQQLVAAAMASGDQMVAGQRFLQEKFGQRSEDLDL